MFRTRILPAAMAALIALGAAGAATASAEEHEGGKEAAAVLGAKTSAAQAIAAAEQKTGGRAMKIEFEKEDGAYVYEVKTASKDEVAKVYVDPASGKVVRVDAKGMIARFFDRDDREEMAKLAAAPTTLAAAIAAAEQKVGGKAVEARFEGEHGHVRFKVEVAKDNAVHRVIVDGATGKVTRVAAAERDHDEDDD